MHSWVDGHFGYFRLLPIMNNVTMDICVQVCICQHMFIFLGGWGGHVLLLKDLHTVIAVTMFSVFLRHIFKIIFKINITNILNVLCWTHIFAEHYCFKEQSVRKIPKWSHSSGWCDVRKGMSQESVSDKYWVLNFHFTEDFLIWISFLKELYSVNCVLRSLLGRGQ